MDIPTFDELKDLAQRDPAGFEQLRTELIEDCIRQSRESHQRRLRGRQFVIEARRRVAGSPMKALLEIQAMMYDSVLSLQHTVRTLRCPSSAEPANTSVLPFRNTPSFLDE